MIIRQEEPKDYEAVYHVVKAAFGSAEHTDGNEQDLVNALRKSKSFIPALSLVAEQDGKVTGHILFTEVKVGGTVQLALAPLSVLPAFQKQGIGKALIRAGHEKAAALGYLYSIVLGSELYYPQIGYLPGDNTASSRPLMCQAKTSWPVNWPWTPRRFPVPSNTRRNSASAERPPANRAAAGPPFSELALLMLNFQDIRQNDGLYGITCKGAVSTETALLIVYQDI